MTGLEAIELGASLAPTIFVYENPALINLDGLSGITSNVVPQGIDQIIILDNPQLNSISGLSSLSSGVSKIVVENNASLTNLNGLENLFRIGALFVQKNENLQQLFTINSEVETLLELHIVENQQLPNLNGFETLTDLDIQLNIDANASLTNLNGLMGLLNNGTHNIPLEIKINNNAILSDIFGLENINFTTLFRVEIQNNSNLSRCDIFSLCNFIQTANETVIDNNSTGCNSIPEVELECSLVDIPDNNFLDALVNHTPTIDTNSDGNIQFDEAEAFTGTIEVANEVISDFTGLEAFMNSSGFNGSGNFASELSLETNTALTSVDFSNNPDLRKVFLKNGNNTAITSFNGVDCPSLEFVCVDDVAFAQANFTNIDPQVTFVEDCEVLAVEDFNLAETVSVFPNPVSETLTISIASNIKVKKVELYSISGQKLLETSAKQLNMSDLSAGIYFVKVISEKGSVTKKIVKQ